jgi:DNA replication factor GINS
MNLDELQSVRDRERQTDKLQQLRASFYADAGEFIQQLREERERAAERADDPFDAPEVNQLTDEIKTAEQTVEAIYEKRVGKIVKAASFAAADLPSESEGMTEEEQALFETLVSDIKDNREHVLDVLAGESSAPMGGSEVGSSDAAPVETETQSGVDSEHDTATDGTSRAVPPEPTDEGPPDTEQSASDETPVQPDQPTDSGVSAADLMGDQSDESTATPEADPPIRKDGGQATAAGLRRETVRITEDIDTFVGFDDREYDLAENDVVTLPSTNVPPLLERGVAKEMD